MITGDSRPVDPTDAPQGAGEKTLVAAAAGAPDPLAPDGPRGRIVDASSARGYLATVGAQVTAFAVAMLLLIVGLALLGYDPGRVVSALWQGSLGSTFALNQSLSEAVPLLLTATAVWVAFQAGLFNIGADGQLQIGGVAAVVVALHAGSGAPTVLLSLVAGCAAGALWATIAGALRAYVGSNEVIATIMLNFIAFAVIDRLISGVLQSPTNQFTPQTDPVPTSMQLGNVAGGVGLPWITLIAIAVGVATVLAVTRTNVGLRLRAVGLNEQASLHAGLSVRRFQLASFAVSGALAGLAGGLVILGYRYYVAPGWAPAWGFLGIVIAFLSLRTPLLIPVWAVILGMIGSAGPTLKSNASVPDSITTLMQTLPVIVLFVFYAGARRLNGRAPGWRTAVRQGGRA
jgi:simple sugar transport system permease protein